MTTYGKILQDIQEALTKQAFIPAPNPQGGGGQMDATGAPEQGAQPPGGQQAPPPQAPPQQPPQDPNAGGQPQGDPNAGGDLAPKEQPHGLKDTMVTLSVADLLDLHSGGKATQSHLKTESMKVKHQFEHQKMLREEQEKQQEAEQQKQQEAAMQAQQQQGMMGQGGIYGGGAMDGSQAGQGQPQPGGM